MKSRPLGLRFSVPGAARVDDRAARAQRFPMHAARAHSANRWRTGTMTTGILPTMSATITPHARHLPPIWLPLLAGLPLAVCLVLMAAPSLGHGVATVSRTLFLMAFLLWVFPLTLLQRRLWSCGTRLWVMTLTLLAATYLMTLLTRVLNIGLQVTIAGSLPPDFSWWLVFRGIEGAWLTLIAFCAIHAVVTYYAELKQEQAHRLEAQSLARDAELRALRYQLQPHFLFNTLNAISALVAEQKGHEARQMLARLGDFLRATLDLGHAHEVSLAEELALTDAYLEIEQARLGDRLQLNWRVGPGLLSARVPYLLLQPLVENAIRHGIAPRRGSGRLEIEITGEAARLQVRISNDLPAGSDGASGTGTGRAEAVGLRNVGDRLSRLYPGAYDLHAGLRDDDRYHVALALPLRLDVGAAA